MSISKLDLMMFYVMRNPVVLFSLINPIREELSVLEREEFERNRRINATRRVFELIQMKEMTDVQAREFVYCTNVALGKAV